MHNYISQSGQPSEGMCADPLIDIENERCEAELTKRREILL